MHWTRLQVGDRIRLRRKHAPGELIVNVTGILEPTVYGRRFIGDDGESCRRFHYEAE